MRINLAKDPSLRSGTTSAYTPLQRAELSVTEEYSFYGKYGLVVSKDDSNGTGVKIAQPVLVEAGKPYAVSIYSRLPVTIPNSEFSEIILQCEWLNSLGVVVKIDTSATLMMDDDDTWYRIGGVWNAPTGATFLSVSITQPIPGTEGAKFILDAMLIEQADYIGGYFDNVTQGEKNQIVNRALSAVPQVVNGIRLGADISLNGLVLNTIDEDDTVWVVTDLDGWWGQTSPELPDIPRGTMDGSYDVEGRLTARTITVRGFFIPKDTGSSLSKSIDRIVEAANMVRKGGWLHAHEEPTKAAWVRLASKPEIDTVNARGRTTFAITLRAGDPIKYHWDDRDPEGFTSDQVESGQNVDERYENLFTNPNLVGSGSVEVYRNHVTNPSFEASSGVVTVAENLFTNPNLVGSGTVPVFENLFTNPNLVGSGTWAEVRANLAIRAVASDAWGVAIVGGGTQTVTTEADPRFGGGFARKSVTTTAGSGGYVSAGSSISGLVVGDVVTFSMRYALSGYSGAAPVINIGGGLPPSTTVLDSGLIDHGDGTKTYWVIRHVTSLGSGTGTGDPILTGFGARPVGMTILAGEAKWEISPVFTPWFSGSTKPADLIQPEDFRTRWLGAANASVSVLEIETVRGLSGGSAVAGVSTDNGKPAVRLIPISPTVSYSHASFPIPTVAQTGGTLVGTIRLSAPLTGGLASQSRRLVAADPASQSVQPPNVAGRYPQRLVFGPVTSPFQARLLNGGGLGSGDVWWTDIGLFAGVYNGPAFSGNASPDPDLTASWTGAVNNSTSVLSGVPVTSFITGGTAMALIRSSRLGPNGQPSARAIRLTVGVNTYARVSGAIPSPQGYASVHFFRETGIGAVGLAVYDQTFGGNNFPMSGMTLTPPDQWGKIQGSGATTGWAGSAHLVLRPPAEGGRSIWYAMPELYNGVYTGPWFSGADRPRLRENYIGDPRFTNIPTNWPIANATTVRVTEGLDVTITSSTGPNFISPRYQWFESFGPGSIMSASYLVENTGTTNLPLQIDVYNGVAYQASSPRVDVAPGERKILRIEGVVAATNALFLQPRLRVAQGETINVGARLLLSEPIVERALTVGPYLDGDLQAPRGFANAWSGTVNASTSYQYDADFEVSWSGTPDASSSLLTGLAVSAWALPTNNSTLLIRSGHWSVAGQYSGRLIPTGPPGGADSFVRVIVPPSALARGSAMVTIHLEAPLSGTLDSRSRRIVAYGPQTSSEPALNARGDHDLTLNFGPLTGGEIRIYHGGGAGAGDMWIDAAGLFTGSYRGSWFSGDVSPDLDLAPSWSGTPNASESVLTGTLVSGVSINNPERAFRIQSVLGVNPGEKSLRVIPRDGGGGATYAELGPFSTVIGETYTVLGRLKLDRPISGGLNTYALGFWVVQGGDPLVSYISQASNAAGVYEVRGTFVATGTTHNIRAMNGGAGPGNADAWWDRLAVVPGTYLGPWFTGDSRDTLENTYYWTGTPNASTSIKDVRYEDSIENIGTATVSGFFTFTGPAGAGTKVYNATTDETMVLQEPLRGSGMIASVSMVEALDDVATITTTGPHGLRVGDEVSLLNVVVPFSESDLSRTVTHVSDVFPYSFSFNMKTDDVNQMSSGGEVTLVHNDVLEVDTYNRAVTYNGDVSGQRYRLTTLTDWIHFAPGKNVIQFLDDPTDVEVISKQLTGNTVTLTTKDAHFFVPNEEVEVVLPVVAPLYRKSLTGNVITLTTEDPHGFSVGDRVDVVSIETANIINKSRTSNTVTLTTESSHGVSASDTIQVSLPTSVAPTNKSLTSNVATLTTQHPHGMSVGDQVTVALPDTATVTAKQISSNQAILTTSAPHNFAVGDSITVTMPVGSTVTGKSRSGSQVIITTAAAHGYSVGDQVVMSLPTTTAPTGNLAGSGMTNLVTVTTSTAHLFSVGDVLTVSGSSRPSYNGTKVVETIPNSTQFTYRDWSLTADANATASGVVITNQTNQSYNGTKTIVSASGTTFAYNL